jgi:ATP adenylyltransferase
MSERPLWAPWRIEYVTSPKGEECLFCRAVSSDDDAANLVLKRARSALIMLNAFPYAPGHVMVVPDRHVAEVEELTADEAAEIMELAQAAVRALRDAMSPDGFNLGLNLGKVAGAGIADHLHLHVVPRWEGDTNFMPVIADTRVLPQALDATRDVLLKSIDNHS